MSGTVFGVKEQNRKGLELLFRYSVIGVGLLAVAYYVGIDGNAFIAIAGGLSVGIGFGIKEIISNFISSIWPRVPAKSINGDTVRKLGLRATQLRRGRDGAELVIPNQTFFTEEATSFTATETSWPVEAQRTATPSNTTRCSITHQTAADSSVNYKLKAQRPAWAAAARHQHTIPFAWYSSCVASLQLTGRGGVMPQSELPEAPGHSEETSGETKTETSSQTRPNSTSGGTVVRNATGSTRVNNRRRAGG